MPTLHPAPNMAGGIQAIPLPPKPAFKFDVLHGTVLLALFLHAVLLFAYAILVANPKEASKAFFSDTLHVVNETAVTMTQIVAPKPPEPVAQPAPQKPVTPQPVKPQATQPAPVAPPVKAPVAAHPQSKPGPARYSPVKTQSVQTGPPVVAAANGTGPAVPSGNSAGPPQGGDPNSHGVGDGTQGGDGAATGGGGGQQTMSVLDYNSFQALGIAEPPTDVAVRAANSKTWEQLADALSLDKNQLFAKDLVQPYCRGLSNPHVTDQYKNKLQGKSGEVSVVCKLGADGVPHPEIVPCGDSDLDTVAMTIAKNSVWLPAMRYGKPTDYEFRFKVVFTVVGQ